VKQQIEVYRFIKESLFPRVRKLAKSNWDKIARVGDALVLRRKLLYADVKRLMKERARVGIPDEAVEWHRSWL
jgi:hypothetical protein